MRFVRLCVAAGVSVGLGALMASPALGAVTLGSSLAQSDSGFGGVCGSPCTLFNTALPGAVLAAPGDGMIVAWRVRSSTADQYRLRVLRPAGGGQLTAVSSSALGTALGGNTVTTFAIQQPVKAGDVIALGMTGSQGVPLAQASGASGSCFGDGVGGTDLADGQTGAPSHCSTGEEYLFNADFVAAPVITSIDPSSGSIRGGNAVVISGSNLDQVSGVRFGSTPATFVPGSSTQFTATAPPGAPGTVDITVTTAGGTSASSTADHYTYLPTPTAPRLASLKLTPDAFLAAPSGPSIADTRYGTTVSYRDSQAASTTFTVLQTRPGIMRGRKCVAPPRRRTNDKLKRCKRTIALGSFTHQDLGGANRYRFTGRIRGRALKPGSYVLRATATRAKLTSKPIRASFRIKKRR